MNRKKNLKKIIVYLFAFSPLAVQANIEEPSHFQPKKAWTIIINIAARNDLRQFAFNNIKQMCSVGSNEHLNVLVHLDISVPGNKQVSRRFYVEKNKLKHINLNDEASQAMDSGDPKTLESLCQLAINNYPAEHYALILWNHGTGYIDPNVGKVINPSELFSFNPAINKYELDRSVGFLDFIQLTENDTRGICWDTTTGNYLTNQKLEQALHNVCTKSLDGKKFDIIGFDACLMSMVEVGSLVEKYGHIMVGSQEVELGMGWNYSKVLRPFKYGVPTPQEFAQHIVETYKETYHSITNDYTQSAIDLDNLSALQQNLHNVSELLIECLYHQVEESAKRVIKNARSRQLCTHFDEPSYIDLYHFYSNLCDSVSQITVNAAHQHIIPLLDQELHTGLSIIEEITIANTTGKNLKNAHGISVYFPEQRIHSSYGLTPFAHSNNWFNFITLYLTR